jgi:hypothetical protein
MRGEASYASEGGFSRRFVRHALGATLRQAMVVDEQAAAVRQQQLHQLLRDQLGDWDRVLVGQDVILRHLAQLGVTTWNKRPPRWTTIRRWTRRHGFPLLRGTKCGRNYFCSVTTQHAVTAWLVSRPANGYPMRVFRSPPPAPPLPVPPWSRGRAGK